MKETPRDEPLAADLLGMVIGQYPVSQAPEPKCMSWSIHHADLESFRTQPTP